MVLQALSAGAEAAQAAEARAQRLPAQASGQASEAVSLSPSEGERCKHQPRSHAKATVQGATAGRCIRLSEEENKERIYIL